jgi:hypothetical protein
VLLLVAVEDLSYEEAARVQGVPIGTVMSRLSRGRERLRRLTGSDADENARHRGADALGKMTRECRCRPQTGTRHSGDERSILRRIRT